MCVTWRAEGLIPTQLVLHETWINDVQILLHIHDSPIALLRFVKRLIKTANVRVAIVSPFAFCVGVRYEQAESRTFAGGGPLQHLEIGSVQFKHYSANI